jgi:F420-non-reducing hydrogenase large subunit
MREIVVSPTTRVEGHGKVTIILDDDGNVSDAYFSATEIRGFEYFLRGMDAGRLPFIISRICGVCSTAHVVASVKAIENVYGVEVTETAHKLRELLLMGQIISNHSLVFYFLTLPDFWFSQETDPSKRNIFQIMKENPRIVKNAIALRRFGNRIMETVGKRDIHVITVIPGGQISPLNEVERESLLNESRSACSITKEALLLCKELFEKINNYTETEAYKTYYMALTKNGSAEFYNGDIHVVKPDGKSLAKFDECEYENYIEEKIYGWTYAKFAYIRDREWPKGIVQVGSMARLNVNSKTGTDSADAELAAFRSAFGKMVHSSLLLDYSRLIELMYACERATKLLEDESITKSKTRVKVAPKGGRGVGVVEAPRGTLIHDYSLSDDNKLVNMRLIIPTQVNNAAINLSLKDAAANCIQQGKASRELLNRIAMVVRAYDPCIKCAARTFDDWLTVEIRDCEGRLLNIVSCK